MTRPESFIATAAARGLEINLFGNRVTVGQSSALVNSSPSAKASGAGVALVAGTVSNSEVNAPNQSAAPPKACQLNVPIGGLLSVELACGESRVDTNNGAPVGVRVGLGRRRRRAGGTSLDPVTNLLRQLLDALLPVVDQTVGTVLNTLSPPSAACSAGWPATWAWAPVPPSPRSPGW